MSPHRHGTSNYRSVCARPSGTFYAEIRSGDMRLDLATFDTVVAAVSAYERHCRALTGRREMNFPEVMTPEWTQIVAPRPRVFTEEDRRRKRRRERRLGIVEMDEHAWQSGADSSRRTSSTSTHSSCKGGRSKPRIVKTCVCRSKPQSSR
ncbi:hypothetical protein D1007_34457 [Hordeum vulgare]|nr:hypothetical protein D1007_34457 [Hordeum vulgare]